MPAERFVRCRLIRTTPQKLSFTTIVEANLQSPPLADALKKSKNRTMVFVVRSRKNQPLTSAYRPLVNAG